MRVLVIGAHFDDAEIGIGGILIKHAAAGDEVFWSVTNRDEWRTGDPQKRSEEQVEACRLLLGEKPGNIISWGERADIPYIISYLDSLKADRLYIPWRYDSHQDHVRASVIGEAVSRKRNIDFFYYDSCSARNFVPNAFVPFDDYEKKLELLDCFKSQNLDWLRIKSRDVYWGTLIDRRYAEGLIVGRYTFPEFSP